ncbi:unnamed protein product [Pedinophyceae sp. YPF-701]|nr:unnamed protein product [Pedinophyceae sp. YPF-701]
MSRSRTPCCSLQGWLGIHATAATPKQALGICQHTEVLVAAAQQLAGGPVPGLRTDTRSAEDRAHNLLLLSRRVPCLVPLGPDGISSAARGTEDGVAALVEALAEAAAAAAPPQRSEYAPGGEAAPSQGAPEPQSASEMFASGRQDKRRAPSAEAPSREGAAGSQEDGGSPEDVALADYADVARGDGAGRDEEGVRPEIGESRSSFDSEAEEVPDEAAPVAFVDRDNYPDASAEVVEEAMQERSEAWARSPDSPHRPESPPEVSEGEAPRPRGPRARPHRRKQPATSAPGPAWRPVGVVPEGRVRRPDDGKNMSLGGGGVSAEQSFVRSLRSGSSGGLRTEQSWRPAGGRLTPSPQRSLAPSPAPSSPRAAGRKRAAKPKPAQPAVRRSLAPELRGASESRRRSRQADRLDTSYSPGARAVPSTAAGFVEAVAQGASRLGAKGLRAMRSAWVASAAAPLPRVGEEVEGGGVEEESLGGEEVGPSFGALVADMASLVSFVRGQVAAHAQGGGGGMSDRDADELRRLGFAPKPAVPGAGLRTVSDARRTYERHMHCDLSRPPRDFPLPQELQGGSQPTHPPREARISEPSGDSLPSSSLPSSSAPSTPDAEPQHGGAPGAAWQPRPTSQPRRAASESRARVDPLVMQRLHGVQRMAAAVSGNNATRRRERAQHAAWMAVAGRAQAALARQRRAQERREALRAEQRMIREEQRATYDARLRRQRAREHEAHRQRVVASRRKELAQEEEETVRRAFLDAIDQRRQVLIDKRKTVLADRVAEDMALATAARPVRAEGPSGREKEERRRVAVMLALMAALEERATRAAGEKRAAEVARAREMEQLAREAVLRERGEAIMGALHEASKAEWAYWQMRARSDGALAQDALHLMGGAED